MDKLNVSQEDRNHSLDRPGMSARHTLIQKRLRDEGDKLLALFEALTPAQWDLAVYTDGLTWTIKDLLAHQVSAEKEFQFYGRDILQGGTGAPEGFNIDAFNNQAVAQWADRSANDLLCDLRATRQDTIELVATIQEEEFGWRGRHPFFGSMSIEDMFKLIYRHNMMHARDIRKILEETTPHDRKQAMHDYLLRTRDELLKVVGQMRPADWDKLVQSVEGGWTAKQVLLHIATAETGQIATGKAIAAGQPTVPDDFDLNRYNTRQVEKNKDRQLPEILSGMAESRQKLLAFLEVVTEADLDKRGKHARGDVITLEQLFYRVGEHEAEHATQIKRALDQ